MTARLDHVWLMSADVSCDRRERLAEPLAVNLDVDDLAFDDLGDGRVSVRVGLGLYLVANTAREASQAYASATFRLIYTMGAPPDMAARRRFACERALPDAWPVWRAWLNGTLAAMGLPPDPLPAGLPQKLLREGEEAFDLTREVEEKLAGEADR